MTRRQMLTRAEEERLRAESRRKEYQRIDHVKMVSQDKLLKANMASEERVEKKRLTRRLINYEKLKKNVHFCIWVVLY